MASSCSRHGSTVPPAFQVRFKKCYQQSAAKTIPHTVSPAYQFKAHESCASPGSLGRRKTMETISDDPKIPRDWTWPFKFTRIIHIVVQEETTHTAKLVFLAMLHVTQHMPWVGFSTCGNHVQYKGGTLGNTNTVAEFGSFVGENKCGLRLFEIQMYCTSIYFALHVTIKRPTLLGCYRMLPAAPLSAGLLQCSWLCCGLG